MSKYLASHPFLMDDETKKRYNVETFMAQFKKEQTEFSPSMGSGDPTAYAYIVKLLMKPVRDGRHRLLWLVIAPYFVTILKQSREDAIKYTTEYFETCNDLAPCSDVLSSVSEFVDHAITEGLYPPHLETLEESDPDLFQIIIEATKE
jgi:hypothetical protein